VEFNYSLTTHCPPERVAAVPLGPVRLRVNCAADLLSAGQNKEVSLARQRPATTARNRTLIARWPNLTEITVEITVTAPRLLPAYVVRPARRAHAALARRRAPTSTQGSTQGRPSNSPSRPTFRIHRRGTNRLPSLPPFVQKLGSP
jgi:hypothetical protein